MTADRVAGAMTVDLEAWVALHPASRAASPAQANPSSGTPASPTRSADLAGVLAEANRRWGNPVDGELSRWLAGADAIVTGQQPGLLGGPLLTLVKAAAVAAEVRRRRASGRDAVGFLWLATADDDLPEMAWGRVAAGEEVLEVREPGWERGLGLGGRMLLSDACEGFLSGLRSKFSGENAKGALDVALSCHAAGVPLGEATATFLARLLAGTGVVLIDALEPEIARAARDTTARVLAELPRCWDAFAAAADRFKAQGWTLPLRIAPHKIPVFRRVGDRRESITTVKGACPTRVLTELADHPERFLPNAWLRPLVADAALGTSVAFLGGAELAYHVQTVDARAVAATARPEWRLRPHVTVVTSAERRLATQLRIDPAEILRPHLPLGSLPGKSTRRRIEQLRTAVSDRLDRVTGSAREEVPGLLGDVEATGRKLDAAVAWLDERLSAAATRDAEVTMGRWRRLRAFLRPDGQPQERRLSVLGPLVRLGVGWPARLVDALDPTDPGMHLLFWGEGGLW